MGASYPTGVKTFTTRSAGQTIQPSHINDLQDEISAIEAGLLSGAAPLNSSNSTLANLSVLGGSTLATLQVNGNSTIAGTLTVQTIVSTSIGAVVLASAVRVQASTFVQYANASSYTRLGLDTKEYDLSSEFDSTTFTFTPKSSGYYSITARYRDLTGAIGQVQLGLFINETNVCNGIASAIAGQVYATPTINWTGHLSSGVPVNLRGYAPSTSRMSSGFYTSAEFIKLF